jgi:hypothetical protein
LPPRFQFTIAVITLVLSISAFAVSWTQAISQQRYNSLAVRPHVAVIAGIWPGGQKTGLYLTNVGLGPAMLKNIRIKVGGQEFEGFGRSPVYQALRAAGLNSQCFVRSWPEEDSWLKSGDDYPLMAETSPGTPECLHEALKLMTVVDMTIEVDYEGLDETSFRFVGKSRINDPEAIEMASRPH